MAAQNQEDLLSAEDVSEFLIGLATELKKAFQGYVLGPEYPPIMKIKNLYHKDIVLKINLSKSLVSSKNIIKKIINLPAFKSIQIHVDVDPY